MKVYLQGCVNSLLLNIALITSEGRVIFFVGTCRESFSLSLSVSLRNVLASREAEIH